MSITKNTADAWPLYPLPIGYIVIGHSFFNFTTYIVLTPRAYYI